LTFRAILGVKAGREQIAPDRLITLYPIVVVFGRKAERGVDSQAKGKQLAERLHVIKTSDHDRLSRIAAVTT
jgi:hypothetical protein